MNREAIARILVEQNGVISMSQARGCGMSEHMVQRKLQTNDWQRLAHGVYLVEGHPRSHRTRLRAAMLSAGDDAVARLTAAWWHGLVKTPPARPCITIPRKRTIQRGGVALRRRDLPEPDIHAVLGITVTSVPLTVLEVGDSVLIDQVLQRHVSLDTLTAAHERNRDRRGARRSAELLRVAATGGRSEAERMLHRLIKHIPGWSAQYPIGGYHLDAAFEEVKLGIEVDGWRWHQDSRRNSKDMRRQNAMGIAGWLVLRFDWHRLANDGPGAVAEIKAAIEARKC